MSEVDVKEVVKEAKTTYDFEARLAGRPMRAEKITLYTDEPTGNKLGYAKDVETRSVLGIKSGTERARAGVLGEIDELEALSAGAPTPEQAKKLKALRKEADALKATLKATSFNIKLRAVPPLIAGSYSRKVRKDLGIKGKGIPEDKEEDFRALSMAYLLADTIVSYEDVREGVVLDKITVENAKTMKAYLPPFEYARLDMLLGNLQFKNSIDESVTDKANF